MLKKVEFNNGLRSIGTNAFYSTRMGMEEPLILPDSVVEIAPGAFVGICIATELRTSLPLDPIWFNSLPAPICPPLTEEEIADVSSPAVQKLLQDAVGRLSQETVRIRWDYQRGLMSRMDMRWCVEEAYDGVIQNLENSLYALFRENGWEWRKEEFRYLNELLLISCGLAYHVNSADYLFISLLEDVDGETDLPARMHRTVPMESVYDDHLPFCIGSFPGRQIH